VPKFGRRQRSRELLKKRSTKATKDLLILMTGVSRLLHSDCQQDFVGTCRCSIEKKKDYEKIIYQFHKVKRTMAENASWGTHRRQEQAKAKKHAILRRTASQKRRVVKERAEEKFADFAENGEWLLESKINAYLEAVMSKEALHPDGVQLVVDTAHRLQEIVDLTPPDNMKGAMAKKPLVSSVEKYGEYINSVQKIDEVFKKYDRHRTGYLSRKELMRMLQDYEMKSDRLSKGLVIRLMVTDEDIDWILQECDSDGTGQISHAEYLPAVAAWEQLAQMKAADQDNCIIL
jgi:Ca2+-binding EF-hand superfamily protein